MKIKTRPDHVGMLEGDELFQMNGWLAELRDEGRAESRDDGSSEAEGSSDTESRDERAESENDGHAEPPDFGHLGPWDGDQDRPGEEGHDEPPDFGHLGPWDGDQAGPAEDGHATPRGDSRAESRDDGYVWPWDDGQAGPAEDGHATPRDDGQAMSPRDGDRRPEALAATAVTRPVTRAHTTGRAVIGDQLRLPIVWCEIGSCISWFAHPAALGEADVRARAMDAGWRVDAVGRLACPQCLQTAPDFQSPLPVVLWDREEAIARSAQTADEPSADAIASAVQELSHDLRPPAGSHRDEVSAASAWMAAVPADGVDRNASRDTSDNASRDTSDEVRRPADDHQPESHPRSGRHRKRLVARLTFAGQ